MDSIEQFYFNMRNKWMYENVSDHIDDLYLEIEREHLEEMSSGREEDKEKS